LLGKDFRRGWVRTSVLGVVAATASVGKLIGLNEAEMVRAFGIAASLACGLQRNFGTMVNPLSAGNAARNGIEAALLAKEGFSSWEGIIEAPSGYYYIFSGQDKAPVETQEALIKALGNPWNLVSPGVMFKSHPCSHISHFGVDAALLLREKNSVDWRQVSEIEFRTPLGKGSYGDPQKALEGKFSLGYCMARTLIDGTLKIADFTDERVNDPVVKQLMSKIKWVAIPAQITGDPFGAQEVVAKLKDGSTYSQKVAHPKGDPLNPATSEELIAKFEDCAAQPGLPEDVVTQIKDLVLNLEKVKGTPEVTALLGGGKKSRAKRK
jgi:2-methylcitrate dehydratase PrpD